MRSSNRKTIFLVIGALALLIAVFAIVYTQFLVQPVQGEKSIGISIVHGDGTNTEKDIQTDAKYLREALEEADLIEGVDMELGLYLLTVDNETADEKNQEWWCITKDGEMVMTGVDITPIENGDRFEIALITGW